MNISETNGSIATKFYLKYYWDGGKAAVGFGPDRIRTLVYMATESSLRVIMVKCLHFFFAVFHPLLFILAGNDDMHESSDEFELGLLRPLTAELAALERLKKSPWAYYGKNNVNFFSTVLDRILFILAGNDCIVH